MAAMLAAARAGEWDLLILLETDCSAHTNLLEQPSLSMPAAWTDEMRASTAALLASILADEAEIRTLCAARLTQLSLQMSSAQMQRKLSRAYDA